MHRSGTSAMSGSLSMAGVDLGPDLMQPAADNPRGYHENQFITDCSDEALRLLGSCWDDPFPLPDCRDWDETLAPVRRKLTAYISDRFPAGRLSGFKDPRLCLLVPFFLEILADLGILPHFVIMLRNPVEVADSLKKRDGFSREKSLLLWMKHLLEAERATRGFPRCFIRFDDLLAAPKETIRSVFGSFGIPLIPPADAHEGPAPDFPDPALRHHLHEPDSIPFRLAAQCFYALDMLVKSDSPDAQARLDSLRQEFGELTGLFYFPEMRVNASSFIVRAAVERDACRAAAQEQARTINGLREELGAIRNSRGWKLLGRYYRVKEFFRRV